MGLICWRTICSLAARCRKEKYGTELVAPHKRGDTCDSTPVSSKISLYFSLLTGILPQRRVRGRILRQLVCRCLAIIDRRGTAYFCMACYLFPIFTLPQIQIFDRICGYLNFYNEIFIRLTLFYRSQAVPMPRRIERQRFPGMGSISRFKRLASMFGMLGSC
jgi:hypothetical protein